MKLIIVSGPSASGKTTLLNRIESEVGLLILGKDQIKELMFDSVKDLDLELAKQLGVASFKILFEIVEQCAKSNTDLVIEGNFRPAFDEEALGALVETYKIEVMQVLLTADADALLARLAARKHSGTRHRGHFDLGREDEFKKLVESGEYRFFDVPTVYKETVDTTDLQSMNLNSVLAAVKNFLA